MFRGLMTIWGRRTADEDKDYLAVASASPMHAPASSACFVIDDDESVIEFDRFASGPGSIEHAQAHFKGFEADMPATMPQSKTWSQRLCEKLSMRSR